jgi:hypothetical protein
LHITAEVKTTKMPSSSSGSRLLFHIRPNSLLSVSKIFLKIFKNNVLFAHAPTANNAILLLSIYSFIQLWYCLGSVLLQAWLLYLGFERYRLYTEMQWPTGAYPQLWLTVSGRGGKYIKNANGQKC